MINEIIFAELVGQSEKRKTEVSTFKYKRFLFEELENKRNVIIGIYGLRGTGKTVLLLQLANVTSNSIYVNIEELIQKQVSIIEFSELAVSKGYTFLFLDEIHAYPNWAFELKILFDRNIKNIYFSGSNAVKIQEHAADLSRRALLFNLRSLSFREFLYLNFNLEIEKQKLEDLLDFKTRKKLITKILPFSNYFAEYMETGALPIYLTNKSEAIQIYDRILQKIIRLDLQAVEKIDVNYVQNAYKILGTLAISSPNEMSYSFLAQQIKKDVYTVEKVINSLNDAGVLNLILPYKKGASMIRKEQKILIALPFRVTLASSLKFKFEEIKGGLREDVFISNTMGLNPLYVKTDRERKTPDFEISGKTFEVGSHSSKRGADYLVTDELIIKENVIPLPLFCLLQ